MARTDAQASPWRRVAKIAAIVVGVFLILIVAAVAALVVYAGSSAFRGEVEQRAGVALGRELKIGDLQINWSWAPRIQLRDVVVGGAAKDAPPLLEAAAVDLRIRLLPLLRGEVILPHLQVEQPKLALHVDEKGVPNWSFSKNPAAAAAAEVATPDERDEAPIIGELMIKEGHFTYQDDAKDLHLEGDITTIHQRRPDSLANGAKWGFAVGAGLGVLGGMAIATEYRDGGVAMIPILALVYGGIGAGTGAGIDALHSSEQAIYATRRASGKVALRPILTGGRKGVAASLGFGGPLRPLKAPAADAAAELPPHLSSRLVADLDVRD